MYWFRAIARRQIVSMLLPPRVGTLSGAAVPVGRPCTTSVSQVAGPVTSQFRIVVGRWALGMSRGMYRRSGTSAVFSLFQK